MYLQYLQALEGIESKLASREFRPLPEAPFSTEYAMIEGDINVENEFPSGEDNDVGRVGFAWRLPWR